MIPFVPTPKLLVLIAVFFATSLISVVTGSTSLITVPVMIQFGIEPHVAVATNMLALVFMSIGGSLPFAQKGVLSRQRLPGLIAITIIGSAVGAFVLLAIPKATLELVIAVAMVGVAIFTLIRPEIGVRARLVAKERNARICSRLPLGNLRGIFQRGLRHSSNDCICVAVRNDVLAIRSHYEGR